MVSFSSLSLCLSCPANVGALTIIPDVFLSHFILGPTTAFSFRPPRHEARPSSIRVVESEIDTELERGLLPFPLNTHPISHPDRVLIAIFAGPDNTGNNNNNDKPTPRNGHMQVTCGTHEARPRASQPHPLRWKCHKTYQAHTK